MEALAQDAGGAPAAPPQGRGTSDRLAELVVHLSGCTAPLAVAAVRTAERDRPPATDEERLGIVARALVAIRHEIDLT